MNKRILLLGALLGAGLSLQAECTRTEGAVPGEWTQDVEAARELAKKEGRYLFMNFTGSDWCGWCKLMDEHVFSQPGWTDFARRRLSLAYIDTPQNKNLVPERYRSRNRKLGKAEGIQGFPTFVIYNPEGKRVGQLQAIRGGNEYTFVTNVVSLIIEDRMPELVSPEECAEYQEAVREKAAWEEKNAAAQAKFRADFAVPYQNNLKALQDERQAILAKATERYRREAKPNSAAEGCEIRFSDFGKGVATNGAAFGSWTADFGAARELAMKSGADLLVAFVGPTWCDWGNQMESNVFNTATWMNFAKDKFVQVYIDCPDENNESKLPEWLLERNARIYKHYQMRGCPFYLLADSEGNRYDGFGATTGTTPEEQIAAVETLLARRRLHQLVSEDDFNRYSELVARENALQAEWSKDYDAFIKEMDDQSETFAPIAEKRNRVFLKALKAADRFL